MRLIQAPWSHRLAGAGVVILAIVSLISIGSAVGDVLAVEQAKRQLGTPSPAASPAAWQQPVPLMQIGDGDAKALLGERLATDIRNAGLATTEVELTSLRPLGGGLQLAQVSVTATGEAPALMALANWVAVNRSAVRMVTLDSQVSDGPSVHKLTLLVVIA